MTPNTLGFWVAGSLGRHTRASKISDQRERWTVRTTRKPEGKFEGLRIARLQRAEVHKHERKR